MHFPKNLSQPRQKILFFGILFTVFVGLVWAIYRFFPGGHDWIDYFYPAAQAVFAGQSPYSVIFRNPPWIILPLLPFALLPPRLGFAILFWLSLIIAGYASYRMGAKPIAILAVLLSYPILANSAYGNIEWLVYLGLVLPPRWGLFLVLAKPQSSIGIVVYWLVEAYREGGIKKVLSTFAPVTILLGLSILIFGPWYQLGVAALDLTDISSSLWPQSIPIGLVLLVYAIRERKIGWALIASPFLAPYLSVNSWGVALIGLSSMPLETVAASVGIWIVRMLSNKFLN
jgi:hypothetical protein